MKYHDAGEEFSRAYADALRRLSEADKGYPFSPNDVEVIACFDQTFGDSSLGRGGPAGQAITTALTSVFGFGKDWLVYRNDRFDYAFTPTPLALELMGRRSLPSYRHRGRIEGRLKLIGAEAR